jgi:acetyltransferase
VSESEREEGAIGASPTAAIARLSDGTTVTVRPIRLSDETAMAAFHRGLSDRSVHQRYFHAIGLAERIAHPRLARVCSAEGGCEFALVAELPLGSGEGIVAVGRLSRERRSSVAELSVVVMDAWQGRGLGAALVRELIALARRKGIASVMASTLPDNLEMQGLLRESGFTLTSEAGEVRAQLHLSPG